MRTLHIATGLTLLTVALLAPASALADTWGEPINTPDRFVVLSSFDNQAVFDKETGLVWEQSPSTTPQGWLVAQNACNSFTSVGNRLGWRLPTLQELASLVDRTQSNPALPAGHPFTNVRSSPYWSATTSSSNPGSAWAVFFNNGGVNTGGKFNSNFVWCVRGGQGVDPQ